MPEDSAVDILVTCIEQLAHCMNIEEVDLVGEQPWYHDIKAFLESGSLSPDTSAANKRTLTCLALKYVLGAGQLYRRSYN